MKLLFDQNVSFRLIKKIQDIFPEAKGVRELGLEGSADKEIWSFAKREHFTVVTFDSDFFDMMVLAGHPPKIIWLRTGNTTTKNIEQLFRKHEEKIKDFVDKEAYQEIGCLEIIEA